METGQTANRLAQSYIGCRTKLYHNGIKQDTVDFPSMFILFGILERKSNFYRLSITGESFVDFTDDDMKGFYYDSVESILIIRLF